MNMAEEHLTDPTKNVSSNPLPGHVIPNFDEAAPIQLLSTMDAPIITSSLPIPVLNILPLHVSNPNSVSASRIPSSLQHTTANMIPDDNAIIAPTTNTPPSLNPVKLELSSNPFGNSVDITIQLKVDHPTLGLELLHHVDKNCITLQRCIPSTPVARIPRWRSTLRDGIIIALDGTPVETITDITKIITYSRATTAKSIAFTIVPAEHVSIRPDTNIPQINFDQMNIMDHQHHAARNDTAP